MSLAEEFLADFDSDEEDDIEDIVDNQIVNSNNNEIDKDEMKIEETNNNNFNVFKVPNMPHKQKTEEISKLKYERLEDVSTLLFDETLSSLLANINSRKEELLTNDSSSLNNNNHNNKIEGEEKEEDISDYNLIVKCNATILKIGEDITKVHKFIRDFFAKKFPELESLVLNAVEYAKVVKLIGNSTNLSQIEFSDILPPPTIMVVKMAGSASVQLKEILSPFILENINKACDGLIKLDEIKNSILEFVESRMATIAPNLTAIVGSAISARLIGIAGGLLPLSRLPACNVQILGSSKKTLEGFSTASTVKHVGFINDCDIISTTPPSLRKKAVRVIAAKCVLAARIDSYKDSPTGDKGLEMRKEIEKKIEKWQEPPPAKQPKPLPAPDDKIKKNRGGKRKRRMKERYAVSDLRKFANRMSFGVSDDEIGSLSLLFYYYYNNIIK